MSGEEYQRLWIEVGRVFSPSAPINKRALFAGRIKQTEQIADAINTRGQHAIMYGDRGVGKTSLANIMREMFDDIEGLQIVKVNCTEKDTFAKVWERAFLEVRIIVEGPDAGGEGGIEAEEYRLSQYIPDGQSLQPADIRQYLTMKCGSDFQLVVVFDEFDRLPASERIAFCDTIKDLSDNSVDATIVLVGVARDVVDLIAEHESVSRCMPQVHMQPMDRKELREIIETARAMVKFTINPDAVNLILNLSQGYPHYTHLIGQESFRIALKGRRKSVTAKDVSDAVAVALDQTHETVSEEYLRAAEGQRKNTLHPQVLLACALARADELGYFRSTDVRGPLQRITNEDYDIPNFSGHLHQLSTDATRGPVLERRGSPRRYKYRFRNPLLRPFIIMKGLKDGVIDGTLLEQVSKLPSPAVTPVLPPRRKPRPKPDSGTSLFD